MRCCYLEVLPRECKELSYDEKVLGKERRSGKKRIRHLHE